MVMAEIRPAALIPTLNNCNTRREVVEGTLRAIPDVLVVDDGSSDSTAEILAAMGNRIRVLRHPTNLGKGRALRDGFEHLLAAGFTHAISLDSDGQHFPEDISVFLAAVQRAPGSLAIGQRDLNGAGAPRKSRFGLWFSNTALRCLGGARLGDSQCGFRSYPLAQVRELGLRGDRYDMELEVLIKAARAGIPLEPVPVQVTYSPPGGRITHFRPVRDFLQIGFAVLRILIGRAR